MLYIHKLKDLNPKSADIESTQLIRELKSKTPMPISEAKFKELVLPFFITDTDRKHILVAIDLLTPTIEELQQLIARNDPLFEQISLTRTLNNLTEIPAPLIANLAYLERLNEWKEQFMHEFPMILNTIPKLRTQQEKVAFNQELNNVFEKILRNTEFCFNFEDIINEAHTEHLHSINEAMNNGFMFHFTLEEEMKKLKFDAIRQRIPPLELAKIDNLSLSLMNIKDGIDRIYELNMKKVNLAVILYSYVKWVNGG